MRRLLLTVLAASTIPAAHAQEAGVTDNEIRLGAMLPMSGPASLIGIAADIGTRIAIGEANARVESMAAR